MVLRLELLPFMCFFSLFLDGSFLLQLLFIMIKFELLVRNVHYFQTLLELRPVNEPVFIAVHHLESLLNLVQISLDVFRLE